MRVTAILGLAGLTACGVAIGAAGSPALVPAARHAYPDWLAGPFSFAGLGLGKTAFGWLLLGMSASYGLVLAGVRALGARAVLVAIVVSHLVFLAAPPLFSADVFGYVAFARLGALHHLDPYGHGAAAMPLDPAFTYIGWHHLTSPYGPLFTVMSYAFVPLGVAGAYWALKALAAACSLAIVALVWRLAQARGVPRVAAIAFVGLNPLLLVYGVAGAHNDFLVMGVVLAAVLVEAGGRPARGGAALVGAAAMKASAALLLPFMAVGSRLRRRTLAGMAGGLFAAGALAVAVFGVHGAHFVEQVRLQQHQVATRSVPNELGRLLGFGGLTGGLRAIALGAFVVAFLLALVRAARGDWIRPAGWATLALLLSTAWLLPWYVVWLVPLAAISGDRRLEGATLVFCAYVVVTRVSFLPG
jgi:hypothetical protein